MQLHPEVIMTIRLPGKVTGQAIIEAVQKLAGKDYYYRQRIIDKKHFYQVGKIGKHSLSDLVIAVDESFSETFIDPESTYDFIAVFYHPMVNLAVVGVSVKETEKAMKEFRDALEKELKSLPN